MKNPDEAIERVLEGLGNSDAPPGMERRILEALEEQASVQSQSVWRRLRLIWPITDLRPIYAASLACSLALIAVVFVIPALRRIGQTSAPNVTAAPAPPSATSEVAVKSAQPPPRSNVRSTQKAIVLLRTKTPTAAVIHNSDSAALDETHAPSFPAPPMPLTEQEKLLLRIAHKRDPVQLVALNSTLQAARDREEKAEVERFFEPKTTGDNE